MAVDTDTTNVFKDSTHFNCQHDLVTECKAAERIKIVLYQFTLIKNNVTEPEIRQLITDTFDNNYYTNTQLVNDFNHLKYDHNVDDNDFVFAKVFEYMTNDKNMECDPNKCVHIRRHYKSESKLMNEYVVSTNND
eukprot:265051_1